MCLVLSYIHKLMSLNLYFFFFETETSYVAQASLKLVNFLP